MMRSLKKIILLCLTISATAVYGQTTTSSPYSIYGLGDLESSGFASHAGMGNARIALRSPLGVNIANPASYGSLVTPTFDLGLSSNFLSLGSGDTTQSNNNTYFRYAALAFPVMKPTARNKHRALGVALGILPFSKIGYEITDQVTAAGETADIIYTGDGGISQIFLGSGFDFPLDSARLHRLGVGFNGSYLFGPLNRTRATVFDPTGNSLNTLIRNSLNVGGVYVDFGLNYSYKIFQARDDKGAIIPDKGITLNGGLTFAPKQNLSVRDRQFVGAARGQIDAPIVPDTLFDAEVEGSLTIPQKFGIGLSMEAYNQWTVALDFTHQDWSDYRLFDEPQSLTSRSRYALGVEYLPNYEASPNKLLQLIRYRAGFRFVDSRLLVNGNNLTEYGINFGLGIPLLRSGIKTDLLRKGAVSMLQLGMEFGQRGRNSDGLIREQFFNFTIGFSFAPSKFDRWFWQRKID